MKDLRIAQNIKAKREKAGWTQTQLATIAGITPSALSQIESGDRFPSTKVLNKLAKALSTTVDKLLGGKKKEDLIDLLQNQEIEALFRGFKELTSNDKRMILDQIKYFKSRKK